MTTFTVTDLRHLFASSEGLAGNPAFGPDELDVALADLGYDSLAMLELAAIVQREYGVRMPDDCVIEMTTPRAAIEYINRRLTEVNAA
ncbi:actinorhodin polyketide synthase acyl carrier protein [Actinoplanes ianthinogenes]|uniref:Actinorhodin polyketide synthase acyl carrier protein n=1 Tax=Actinoplanes ianthinogenes TaxID=122358 RepID=A0ABM7M8T4_9ACTN|nr:phosphopantetheine-binding protein [Actinoplanes ianthinogenes]BCJ48001.1 actinorhodin polyketide synthase acyl carrier protein [Actinoplanes ianthinogenes]GGR05698.1 actinorhodin polyketide synthase acyl carrier protein [Actinoplanes ianthinogenes]